MGGQLFDMPWLLALSRVSTGALCFLTSEMGRVVPLIMCVNVWPHRMNFRQATDPVHGPSPRPRL